MFTAEDLIARLNGPREFVRARDLAGMKNGVKFDELTADRIKARVRSSKGEPYTVEVFSSLAGTCHCPAWAMSKERRFCKHMAAAAVAWLDSLGAPLVATSETVPIDDTVKRAVAALSESECRVLIAEAAAMNDEVKARLLNGAWTSSSS